MLVCVCVCARARVCVSVHYIAKASVHVLTVFVISRLLLLRERETVGPAPCIQINGRPHDRGGQLTRPLGLLVGNNGFFCEGVSLSLRGQYLRVLLVLHFGYVCKIIPLYIPLKTSTQKCAG